MILLVDFEGGLLSREGWPQIKGGSRHNEYVEYYKLNHDPQINDWVHALLVSNMLSYEPAGLYFPFPAGGDLEYHLRKKFAALDQAGCFWQFKTHLSYAADRYHLLKRMQNADAVDATPLVVCCPTQEFRWREAFQGDRGFILSAKELQPKVSNFNKYNKLRGE